MVLSILNRLSNLSKGTVQLAQTTSRKETYNYPDITDGGILDYLLTLESRISNDGGDLEIVAWR